MGGRGFGDVVALAGQQTLHACEPRGVDDAGQPLIARASGNPGRAALGHVDLVARRAAECLDEAVEPRRLARGDAGGGCAFREPEIVALPPLLADARGATHAVMPALALGIELARAFGKVIASHLAGDRKSVV